MFKDINSGQVAKNYEKISAFFNGEKILIQMTVSITLHPLDWHELRISSDIAGKRTCGHC